ncbi:MFS general substrate transporter [Podospora conica]|nr:MFS general substrate transporter [Schizothecium conicum]
MPPSNSPSHPPRDPPSDDSDAGVTATENTPLLATADLAALDPDIAEVPAANGPSSAGAGDDEDDDDKPLPLRQVFVLCYGRFVEPVAFFSIFPYINKMAQRNGNLADADVGFYSGLIESMFSLTQMVLMILWGRAADRYGRKPVLVFSLLGVSLATVLFGLAQTIWQMVLFRCLAGVFAGTIVTIRTMLSEVSASKTQARAFSWFAFAGHLGIFIGPLLGGALAEPAEQYPNLFGGIRFLEEYPYILPSLAVSAIGLSAVLLTLFVAEETLIRPLPGAGDEPGRPKPAPLTTWDILKSPGVPIVLYTYAHVMLLAFSYTAIAPVFWFTPIPLGGLSFTPLQIALFMGLGGLSQAIWILVVFPPLQHRIGTNGVMRWCATAYPVFFVAFPAFNLLLARGFDTAFWVVAPPLYCVSSGVSMSFTAIQLALNDVSPSPAVLGTLNALALSLITGVRAFSPALFASLYAVGARTQWLGGYAIWVLMTAIALGFTVVSRYLPDYGKLKKRRAERAR